MRIRVLSVWQGRQPHGAGGDSRRRADLGNEADLAARLRSEDTKRAPVSLVTVKPDRPPEAPIAATSFNRMRTLVLENSLDEAASVAAALLQQRIAAGDVELASVGLLLQHYETVLYRLPPLGHTEMVALRPSEELYACFDQFVDLLRQQGQQIAELQAILSEMI
jgi:hypothetical protein